MASTTAHAIRPVRNDADLEAATVRAMALFEKAEHRSLTAGERDELDILLALIEHYEARHGHRLLDERAPLERLRSLMEEAAMNANDLGRLLGQRQLGSAILLGRRELNKRHVAVLARHFHVSPALFFE